MTTPPLTIIIPVRKEEETIIQTLDRLSKNVQTPHRILIADDCIDKNDKTMSLVKKYVKKHTNVHIRSKKSSDQDGFGPALCRAIVSVTTHFLVIVMADSCDDPKTIDTMMDMMKKRNVDVIVGCRYMKRAKKSGGPLVQHLGSTMVNTVLPVISGFPTHDATNAFKMWRTSFVRSILPAVPLPGVEFSFQLTIEAVKHHGRFYDVPTQWIGRTLGTSKFKIMKQTLTYGRLFFRSLYI